MPRIQFRSSSGSPNPMQKGFGNTGGFTTNQQGPRQQQGQGGTPTPTPPPSGGTGGTGSGTGGSQIPTRPPRSYSATATPGIEDAPGLEELQQSTTTRPLGPGQAGPRELSPLSEPETLGPGNRSNPYRVQGRADYHPDTHGMPENIQESFYAQRYVDLERKNVAHIFFRENPYTGGEWWNAQTNTQATGDEIARAQRVQDLQQSINDIRVADSEFRAQNTMSQLEHARTAGRDQMLFRQQQELETSRQQGEQALLEQKGELERRRIALENQLKENIATDEHKHELELQKNQIDADMKRLETQLDEQGRQFDEELSRRTTEFDLQLNHELTLQQMQVDLETSLLDKKIQADQNLQQIQNSFQQTQNSLDRALQRQELEEAQRAAMSMEDLRQQEVDLDKQRFQMDTVLTIAQSPEMMYFMVQNGMLPQFQDVLGDSADILTTIVENLGTGPGSNIQQFARMSGGQQDIERYRITATTGAQNPDQALRGAAPRAVLNRPQIGQPVTGGSGASPIRVR